MPKRVDHDRRRDEIAAAVARLATSRGLRDVSFREVAAEAGMSVANVQHYFPSKLELLEGTLDRQSRAMGARILDRIGALGPEATPLAQIRVVAQSFLPTDKTARNAMLLYHAFASAALTDPTLRSNEAFAAGHETIAFFADRLRAGRAGGEVSHDVDPDRAAVALIALVLGLSLCVLLERIDATTAAGAFEDHLSQLLERR